MNRRMDEQCLGCTKRPEVYGSSWCAACSIAIPHGVQDRMIGMRNLIAQADPWVQTRMHKHQRQAANEKREYYRARHAREADYCEGWLAGAAHFLPYEHLDLGSPSRPDNLSTGSPPSDATQNRKAEHGDE